MSRILIVEDEAAIRRFIEINLKREGFTIDSVGSGEEALEMVRHHDMDLIVLDITLPGIDGFQTCMQLRESNYIGYILMLTARGQDMDRIMGLDLGADDYMVKPFNPLELAARIRAMLRRYQRGTNTKTENHLTYGALVIDLAARSVSLEGNVVSMTPKEYELLTFLAANNNRALHRDELLDAVWGSDFFGDYKTVDVHIHRLREKIETKSCKQNLIKTVWGVGYRWHASEQPHDA